MEMEYVNYITEKVYSVYKVEFSPKSIYILEFVCCNFKEYNISVKYMAQNLKLSTKRINELCNSYFRMNPGLLINYVRMLYCLDCINKGENTVKILSGKCGYKNLRTFNLNFKKVVGKSVAEFLIEYKSRNFVQIKDQLYDNVRFK